MFFNDGVRDDRVFREPVDDRRRCADFLNISLLFQFLQVPMYERRAVLPSFCCISDGICSPVASRRVIAVFLFSFPFLSIYLLYTKNTLYIKGFFSTPLKIQGEMPVHFVRIGYKKCPYSSRYFFSNLVNTGSFLWIVRTIYSVQKNPPPFQRGLFSTLHGYQSVLKGSSD